MQTPFWKPKAKELDVNRLNIIIQHDTCGAYLIYIDFKIYLHTYSMMCSSYIFHEYVLNIHVSTVYFMIYEFSVWVLRPETLSQYPSLSKSTL